MPVKKLKQFLDEHKVKYVSIQHSPAYTAQAIAASAHVPERELAKTVMVTIDGKIAMAVLPASYRLDVGQLRRAVNAKHVELATEGEFEGRFPDCEIGAMPPFGNLYDMEVYVAGPLADDEEIAFNAGSHRELIKMRYEDFAWLVQPKVLEITVPIGS